MPKLNAVSLLVRVRKELQCLPRDLRNVFRFGKNAPKKHQTIYVDPKKITYTIQDPKRFKSSYFSGLVLDGDWDKGGRLFADCRPAIFLRGRIRENKSWEELGAYTAMLNRVAKLGKADGCRDLPDIIARYQRLDLFIQSLERGDEFLSWKDIKATNIREIGGVLVHVGRDGELFHSEKGNHRLAVAQELGLNWIPAQVGVVHRLAVENGSFQSLTKRPACGQTPRAASRD